MHSVLASSPHFGALPMGPPGLREPKTDPGLAQALAAAEAAAEAVAEAVVAAGVAAGVAARSWACGSEGPFFFLGLSDCKAKKAPGCAQSLFLLCPSGKSRLSCQSGHRSFAWPWRTQRRAQRMQGNA